MRIHIFFPAALPLAERTGKLRAEQFRVQRIQIRPYLQQDKACFIRIAAASPLARGGEPVEMAEWVLMAAGLRNTYMTGANINVDGGSDFT